MNPNHASSRISPLLALTLVFLLVACGQAQLPPQPRAQNISYTITSDPLAPPQPPSWKPLPPRGSVSASNEYQEPPQQVIDLLEHEPDPTVVVHATSKRIVRLYEQPLLPMSQLSRPRLGLAGLRIDPANHTQGVGALHTRAVIGHINDPDVRLEVPAPYGALIGGVSFSPDGKHLAASLVYSTITQLATIDTDTGELTILSTGSLSAVWNEPCSWITNQQLLCARPQFDGSPPAVEVKPNIQELLDGAVAAITYQNLLKDSKDDLLLEHFGSVELFIYDLNLGSISDLPGPGLITAASISPDGHYLLTERIERPYPRFIPVDRFQRQISIFDVATGDAVLRVGATEDSEVSTALAWGPRQAAWDPNRNSTVGYIFREQNSKQADSDSLIFRQPPFESTLRLAATRLNKVKTWGYTSSKNLYVVDTGKTARSWISYLIDGEPHLLSQGTETQIIGDLSQALKLHGNLGPVLEYQSKFYFLTEEAKEQDIYFRLSEWDSKNQITRPLWRNLEQEHASVLAVLDPKERDYLIRTETPTISPYLVVSEGGVRRPLTHPSPPFPELAGVTRQQIFYRRDDSVTLSAMLYLPVDFRPGKRLPTVLWIYPKDFNDQEQASRLSEHPRRYFAVRGPSRFSLLTQGYALVDAPSIPIIGEVTSGLDDYLPQLIQSAEAAINYLVEHGISNRNNIAVVGRSYGAFAVANLMAHTTLFKTGIAMSGAYNRTLTPFGFQHETRTFWQNTEAYVNLSPFFFANKVSGSLLLLHGEDDDNAGTPAFQSERFYAALAGNGVKSRYVSFPYEGHQFRGRRTVHHATAEMINWLDRHMK